MINPTRTLGFPLMPSRACLTLSVPASLCLCLSAEHRLRNADDMGGADAFLAVPVRATPSLKRRLLLALGTVLQTCPFFFEKCPSFFEK